MSEYLPYAGQHSIEEALVALQLQHGFDEQEMASARASVEADLKDVLPRSAELRGGSITVDLSNLEAPVRQGPVSSNLAGFQFSRVKGDGKPAQVLTLSDNVLSVNVLEYEGWNKVQDDGIKYITAVLASLSLAGNPVMTISLQFKDRYTFNGNYRDAQAALLFVKGNEYLSTRCFNAGPLWHCHTGWFDVADAGERVLNQLNIGSGMVDQASTVTIDHRATFNLSTPRQSLEALLHPSGGSRCLREVLDVLHDKNKSILRALLQPGMLAKIGMDI